MDAFNNILKFLRGEKYDDKTIMSDIKLLDRPDLQILMGSPSFKNPYDYAMSCLLSEINDLNVALINKDYYRDENIWKFNIFYNIPFKGSRNPLAFAEIICKYEHFNIEPVFDTSDYFECNRWYLELVANIINKYKISVCSEFMDNLRSFTHKGFDFITLHNMKTTKYVGHFHPIPYPKDIQTAQNNYLSSLKKGVDISTHLGRYGEAIAVRLLNKLYGDNINNFYWVSNFLGDGFGYDLYVDYDNSQCSAYEVKAHYNVDEFEKSNLTTYENIVEKRSHKPDSIFNYSLLKVLVNDIDGTVQKIEERTRDENGNWYVRKLVDNTIYLPARNK